MAIDGSTIKAVNSRDRSFPVGRMKLRLQQIEERVGRQLSRLDTADRQESQGSQAKVERLQGRLEKRKVTGGRATWRA